MPFWSDVDDDAIFIEFCADDSGGLEGEEDIEYTGGAHRDRGLCLVFGDFEDTPFPCAPSNDQRAYYPGDAQEPGERDRCAMIDYVYIPNLRCLSCGKITARVTRQTYINKEPHSDGYTIGSRFDLPEDTRGFEDRDYLPIRPDLAIGERLRVLEVWYCGHCGTSSPCVWSFENNVLVEARLAETSLAVFAEVDLVTRAIDTDWLREELLDLYPDDAETIEFLTLQECLQVITSGHMIDDSD